MLKRLILALSLAFGLLSPSFGAGTITMSLTQRFDNSTHLPLSGGLIYFIQAGTTSTPQNAFIDSALTLPYANPLTLDSGGNVPQLFFADGVVKVRITNSLGVQQLIQDNIQVTGASSGGGGGGTVDPTTIIATGDMKARYGTGVLSGFVRANGRTIGSATSGASERANSDCQALFEYLWGADANLTVSTGRGASANADWVANKTIALPDWRGRVIAGLDDMGSTAAGRLSATYFGASGIVLGASGGSQSHTLTIAELASHTHTGTTLNESNDHTHVVSGNTGTESATHTHSYNNSNGASAGVTGGGGLSLPISDLGGTTGTESATHFHSFNVASGGVSVNHTHSFTTAFSGSGTPHTTTQPTALATFYMKL